jgi:putative SOS response-associated peptidase YedK
MRPIHDRMPVILPRSSWDAWLDRELRDASAVADIAAGPPVALTHRPVSPAVNSPRNNHPGLLDSV